MYNVRPKKLQVLPMAEKPKPIEPSKFVSRRQGSPKTVLMALNTGIWGIFEGSRGGGLGKP